MCVLRFWEIILWYCFTLFLSVLTFWNSYYWILMLYLYTKHEHDEAVHWESFGRIGRYFGSSQTPKELGSSGCATSGVRAVWAPAGMAAGRASPQALAATSSSVPFLMDAAMLFLFVLGNVVPIWPGAEHLHWFSCTKVWVYFPDLLIRFFCFLREAVTLW